MSFLVLTEQHLKLLGPEIRVSIVNSFVALRKTERRDFMHTPVTLRNLLTALSPIFSPVK